LLTLRIKCRIAYLFAQLLALVNLFSGVEKQVVGLAIANGMGGGYHRDEARL
jgi:hypothetical protein